MSVELGLVPVIPTVSSDGSSQSATDRRYTGRNLSSKLTPRVA